MAAHDKVPKREELQVNDYSKIQKRLNQHFSLNNHLSFAEKSVNF